MPARKAPPWSSQEIAILQEYYPVGGINAVTDLLPERSWRAIHVMAHKLGVRCEMVTDAPKPRLSGERLERAIRLREDHGWSFARIGAELGVSEAGASNAVIMALCERRGFTPAQRDRHGRLTDEGLERVRYALKKGLKAVDIQLRLGVSAGCVAEQRRRYNRDLKSRGKAELPPPGGGMAYCGVKIARTTRSEVERLFLEGLGTLKVSERTGASKTTCTRIRARLVRKLARQGKYLPGCDADGKRRVHAESARFITPEQRDHLRTMLLDRIPVKRAASMTAVGSSSAYRIRYELAAELAARGEALPPPRLPGRIRPGTSAISHWPPSSAAEIYAFRAMLKDLPFSEAKEQWRAERTAAARAEAERPKSFEEKLRLVASGKATLVPSIPRSHLEPRAALGGTA